MPLVKVISKARLRIRDFALASRSAVTRPDGNSPSENVFHCCLHKSGSQWVRRILKDARIYQHTGLRAHHYQSAMPGGHDPRPVNARTFDHPFPPRTVITPLYIDYPGYLSIPKPDSARAFFVTRDPRDIVVSWYFSSKYSHRLMGDLGEARAALSDLDEVAGMQYTIRHLADFGLFDAQRSWLTSDSDETTLVVKFEDLIGEGGINEFASLFEHCRMELPRSTLEAILDTYSFERLSGRDRGEEVAEAHFRKGIAGDWRNHFGAPVQATFAEVTGDLVKQLGYPET